MLHVNVYDPFWWSWSHFFFFIQVISDASSYHNWHPLSINVTHKPAIKNSSQRPSTYPQADETPCSPSRWCTAPCRAAARVGASPLRRAAGSGVRARTCWCRHRRTDSRRARRWGSSRSRAPSPADSLWAREGTWTAPSGRTARTAHTSPSIGTQPTETASLRIRRSWGALLLFFLVFGKRILFTLILPIWSEQFVIILSDAPLLQVIGI